MEQCRAVSFVARFDSMPSSREERDSTFRETVPGEKQFVFCSGAVAFATGGREDEGNRFRETKPKSKRTLLPRAPEMRVAEMCGPKNKNPSYSSFSTDARSVQRRGGVC